MKAKRYLFLFLGFGLLIYGVVQIAVTIWQIYSSDFSAQVLTHPQILLMGAVHFAAAFLGLMSIAWSWKFVASKEPLAAPAEAAPAAPIAEEPQHSDDPADAL